CGGGLASPPAGPPPGPPPRATPAPNTPPGGPPHAPAPAPSSVTHQPRHAALVQLFGGYSLSSSPALPSASALEELRRFGAPRLFRGLRLFGAWGFWIAPGRASRFGRFSSASNGAGLAGWVTRCGFGRVGGPRCGRGRG